MAHQRMTTTDTARSFAHSPIQAILTSAHQVQRVEAALAGRGKVLGLVGEERLGVEGELYHGHGERAGLPVRLISMVRGMKLD